MDAYAWMSGLALTDLAMGLGRVVLGVHPNAEAWQARPVGQIIVDLGQPLVPPDFSASPPRPAAQAPTLAGLMADPEFAAAYGVIGAKIYAALLAVHPALAGATIVP